MWPPQLGPAEQTAVLKAADLPAESSVARLEGTLAETVDSPHAIAFSSCTTAIHAVAAILGPDAGTTTAAPGFTFAGTWTGPAHLRHTPVYVDVDPETLTIGHPPETDLTIAVDLHGVPHNLDRTSKTLITDACQSFGTEVSGKLLGSEGTHCWSFSSAKAVPSFAGGAVTTSDDELADKLRAIRDYGVTGTGPRAAEPNTIMWGHNWRMTGPDAALAEIRILKALKPGGWSDQMHSVGEHLRNEAALSGFTVQSAPANVRVAWHKIRLGWADTPISELSKVLTGHGVPWHRWGLPLDETFPWQKTEADIPVSRKVAETTLCITTEKEPFWTLPERKITQIIRGLQHAAEELGK